MSLGEYDLGDLMEGDQQYITSVGKDFTMALVVLLAILGRYDLQTRIIFYISESYIAFSKSMHNGYFQF